MQTSVSHEQSTHAARFLIMYHDGGRWWHHATAETLLDAEWLAAELQRENPELIGQVQIISAPTLDRSALSALVADTHGLDEAMAQEMRR